MRIEGPSKEWYEKKISDLEKQISDLKKQISDLEKHVSFIYRSVETIATYSQEVKTLKLCKIIFLEAVIFIRSLSIESRLRDFRNKLFQEEKDNEIFKL